MKIQREKYSKNFKNSLKQSRQLTENICKKLDNPILFPDIFCQDQFDKLPFKGNGGETVRFADIFIFNLRKQEYYFVEAKDFGSAIFYDATGLPKKYIDNKMKVLGSNRVYMVFCENKNIIEARRKHNRKIYFTNFEKRVFIPYGERLDILMQNRYKKAELKVLSKFNSYYNEEQYMWKLNCCKPIIDVFIRDFGSNKKRKD